MEARQTQRETTRIAAETAKTQAELAVQWKQTMQTADPNDPDTAKNFLANVAQPRFDAINSLAGTRGSKDFAARTMAATQAHFYETTHMDQMELSSVADIQNLDMAANALSSAAAIDPSSLDFQISQYGAMSENLMQTHGLSREQKLALDQKFAGEAAMAAARSMAELNPAGAQELIKSGRYDKYLSGEQQMVVSGYVDTQMRAQAVAAKQAREEQASQASSDYLGGMINQETGAINVTPDMFKQLAEDPRFKTPEGADQQRTIFSLMNAELNRQAAGGGARKTDPATYANFRSRLFLSPDDANKLTMADVQGAFATGNLNSEDMDWFRTNLVGNDPAKKAQQKALDDVLAGFKSSIGASSMMVSKPLGDQRFLVFSQDVQKNFDKGLAAGKSTTDLLDPRSKDFVGKEWQRYAVTDDEATAQMLGEPTSMPAYGVTQSLGPQASADEIFAPNAPSKTIAAVQTLTQTSTPDEVKQVVPMVADKYGVPQHIALALVEQESTFNPTAGSPTGATGLTQLTQPIERQYGLADNDPDPNKNLDAGLHYLADLKDQWGTWELALKHYGDANQTGYASEVIAKSAKYRATGPARVATDADFAALPSGAVFVGPDGKTRKKP